MEKIIYLAWRAPAQAPAAFHAALRGKLADGLRTAGVRGLRLNLPDDDVTPAAGSRQAVLQPPPDALIQVWLDSAIRKERAPVDAAIATHVQRSAAYLVTESQPLRNLRHPSTPGKRTYGYAQVAILRKPAGLPYPEWLSRWHDHHTTVAIETQSTFEYLQNVVVRPLTEQAPALDAIVEECFPPEAMVDHTVFFGAPGDTEKTKRHIDRMMESVHRFIEPGTIDVVPTSQYDLVPITPSSL